MKSLPQTGNWYYEKHFMTWNPESVLNAYISLRKTMTMEWQKRKYSHEQRKWQANHRRGNSDGYKEIKRNREECKLKQHWATISHP